MHTKRWVVAPPITLQADQALAKFPPILKQIVFNRGLATDAEARAFLKAEPNSNTDPLQLTGMDAAVDRICFALQHKEPIAIYGDYDVDGVTATALLVQALSSWARTCAATSPTASTRVTASTRTLWIPSKRMA